MGHARKSRPVLDYKIADSGSLDQLLFFILDPMYLFPIKPCFPYQWLANEALNTTSKMLQQPFDLNVKESL